MSDETPGKGSAAAAGGGEFSIYTDGGCSGNPGPGGWAYVILTPGESGPLVCAEEAGGESWTTNNRMELSAVIEALKKVKTLPGNESRISSAKITIYTDSQYVQKGITEWIHTWKLKGWRNSNKSPVKNQDLWQDLDSLAGALPLVWQWVKGHAGNKYNEKCDAMVQNIIHGLSLQNN
ncbi:MAG: ribonuclease HI [Treponema sp.]|nr:ribonuclease HI [Treponema sp.]